MKCPNCGCEIIADDTFDTEWCYGRYYDNVRGTCRHCNKTYSWTEVYVFDHIIDIKELTQS